MLTRSRFQMQVYDLQSKCKYQMFMIVPIKQLNQIDETNNRYAVLVEDEGTSSVYQCRQILISTNSLLWKIPEKIEITQNHDSTRYVNQRKSRIIEAKTLLHPYNSVTKALEKCDHPSKPTTLAELKQMLEKELSEYFLKEILNKALPQYYSQSIQQLYHFCFVTSSRTFWKYSFLYL